MKKVLLSLFVALLLGVNGFGSQCNNLAFGKEIWGTYIQTKDKNNLSLLNDEKYYNKTILDYLSIPWIWEKNKSIKHEDINDYLIIDLEKTTNISDITIQINNRGTRYGDQRAVCFILYSNDGSNWTYYDYIEFNYSGGTNPKLFKNISTRFLKFKFAAMLSSEFVVTEILVFEKNDLTFNIKQEGEYFKKGDSVKLYPIDIYPFDNRRPLRFEWSTGDTTSYIFAKTPGTYTLKISNHYDDSEIFWCFGSNFTLVSKTITAVENSFDQENIEDNYRYFDIFGNEIKDLYNYNQYFRLNTRTNKLEGCLK